MIADVRADRIGIVPSFSPSSGGEFQYSLSLIRALDRLDSAPRSFVFFVRDDERAILEDLNLSPRFDLAQLEPAGSSRLLGKAKALVRRLPAISHLRALRQRLARPQVDPDRSPHMRPYYGAHFRAERARWILYAAPNILSFEAGVPFAMPIHDMQHRLQPHFPEVSADGEWERREYLFGNAARSARMILVDSEVGKEDVLNFYGKLGLTADRVGVLPYLPPDYLRESVSDDVRQSVRRRYALPERYLFYPAQFWPHKNHKRLVQAVGILADRLKDLHLVLAGSAHGSIRTATFEEAMREAARLGVGSRIHNLGYVPNEDMAALYAGSSALVFPTFFGPTNIPILEAWALGVPVITSRLRGITEQVGDAGLLVDPLDSENMAFAIQQVWTDSGVAAEMAERGRHRLNLYDRPQFEARLFDILQRIEEV